jgi:hypothetical protein
LHDTYLKGFIDMHIIFGEAVKNIPDSFTVLELDTFNLVDENRTVTAYCVVEKIPLTEFALLENNKKSHSDLMRCYREKQWQQCEQIIETLMGMWNNELDSFYTDLLSRISELKHKDIDANWQGYVERRSNS